MSDATLEATIDPEGLPKGADYQFQLVKNASKYLPGLVCAEAGVVQPVGNDGCLDPPGWPSGTIPLLSIGGSEGEPVSLDLVSVGVTLQPDTTYHYRLLAAESLNGEDGVLWEAPAAVGPDQTFTTPKSAKEEAIQKLVEEHQTGRRRSGRQRSGSQEAARRNDSSSGEEKARRRSRKETYSCENNHAEGNDKSRGAREGPSCLREEAKEEASRVQEASSPQVRTDEEKQQKEVAIARGDWRLGQTPPNQSSRQRSGCRLPVDLVTRRSVSSVR